MIDFTKRFKIFIYIFGMCSFIIYLFASTYTYQNKLENVNIQAKIDELDEQNENLYINIQTKYSRDNIRKRYPQLNLYGNIYYLAKEGKDE
ncbi:MAG: hypothetical protein ACRCUP_01500 [Mycoplasmatales bacterium]